MVIVRTRHCERCDRDRLRPDEIGANHRTCRECAKANARASSRRWNREHAARLAVTSGRWNREHREAGRESNLRWVARNPEKARQAHHEYWRRLRNDPVRWQAWLDNHRICDRIRNQRPPVPEDVYLQRYGHGWRKAERVDVAPLRPLLAEVEPQVLSFRSGVEDTVIYRLLRGYYDEKGIGVRVADRICVALGVPLELLYPAGDS